MVDRARWAANAHNVQSWKLVGVPGHPEQKRLILDARRLLPQTDPPSRQLTISLGTFLAVVEDEAGAKGARVTWRPLVDQPGALVTLSPGPMVPLASGSIDALTAPTVKYRTQGFELSVEARKASQDRSTETVRVQWLGGVDVAAVKTWARRAMALEMDLPRTRDESIVYTHYGSEARTKTPYGITLVPNFPQSELFWVEAAVCLFAQGPEDYARSAKEMFSKALDPVSQVVVLTSHGNGVAERIQTGEVLQRLWTDVRAQGGELLPLSQGLQEFPEMASLRAEAHRRWAQDGETVQMVLALFRPGPGHFLASPRLDPGQFIE